MKSKVPRSLHSHTTSFAGRGTSAESLDHSRVGFKKSTVRYLSQGHGDSVPGIGNEKVSVTIAQPVVVINVVLRLCWIDDESMLNSIFPELGACRAA